MQFNGKFLVLEVGETFRARWLTSHEKACSRTDIIEFGPSNFQPVWGCDDTIVPKRVLRVMPKDGCLLASVVSVQDEIGLAPGGGPQWVTLDVNVDVEPAADDVTTGVDDHQFVRMKKRWSCGHRRDIEMHCVVCAAFGRLVQM